MKRLFYILFFVFLPMLNVAQNAPIVLRSFVKKDTVQLRWAPTTADIFISGLKNGYTIKRLNTKTYQESTLSIPPLEERIDTYKNSKDTLTAFMSSFVFEFMNKSFESDADKAMPFSMLSLSSSSNRSIATICGVYYEDVELASSTYQYQVTVSGETDTSNTVRVHPKELSKNPDCSKLYGESRVDLKEAYLKWEAKALNPSYGGYWIYKSENNRDFYQLNESPLFHFTSQYEKNKTIIDFVDTAVVEGETYYYKVLPINHFADPGKYSNTVEVYIQKRLNGLTIIDTVRADVLERKIEGYYTSTHPEDDVKEFCLYRGDKIDSSYALLEKKGYTDSTFSFTYQADKLSGDRHYFKVATVSVDGDTAFSYPYYYFTLDQEPPAVPTEFKGEIDTNGIAHLSWTPPGDNDLRGYRIFRSNELGVEFKEVTKRLSLDTTYQDTVRLDNLTSVIYYLIRAVDQNWNNSDRSEPILLMKPDTIAPVNPVIKHYKVQDEGIYLDWANSSSEDVEQQYLLRKQENSIDTILNFTKEYSEIIDTTVILGQTYFYYLIALDKAKNAGVSKSIPVTFELGYRLPPKGIKAEADIEAKKILLSWQPLNGEIYSIDIYRSKNDGRFKHYKTIRENVTKFEDDNLYINNIYNYKIKVMYQSGISSKMSEVVEVVY